MTPSSSVNDDVPIFTTTELTRSPENLLAYSLVFLVVEAEITDVNRVAGRHPGPPEHSEHTELLEPRLGKLECLVIGEIAERNGSHRRSTDNVPRPIIEALDRNLPTERPMQGRGLDRRRRRPRLANERRKTTQHRWKAGTGHRGNDRAIEVVVRSQVAPRSDDEPGPVEQIGSIAADFVEQHLELLVRRHAVPRREIEQHQQDPGSFDVAEELMAQPLPVACPLDQPRNVGQHHLEPIIHPHHAEVRLEGREGIVGDLRLGRRDAADERRFPDVREADDGNVGHQLELEPEPPLFAVLALLGERRRPSLVAQKPRVASATLPCLRCEPAVTMVEKIGQRLSARMIEHDGTLRDLDLEVAPPGAVTIAATAMHATLTFAMRMIPKREQRRHISIGNEPDRAPVTAIAAIRAPLRHVGFAPKRNTARATITALDVDVALVDEVGHACKATQSPLGRSRLSAWQGSPDPRVNRTVQLPLYHAPMRAERELTEREALWGTTMRGHRTDGVEVAHDDSTAAVAPGSALEREAREAIEAASLRAGATLGVGAGTRMVEEAPDRTRTCFERDRDRILHASAFRRLAGKTQVFVFPDDHQRTRLTHALEVAQVARSVSWALGLNVPLTEAIALGHDCGHGPGGHASEDALSPFVEGGFNHAEWGADVTLRSLNLCEETLDGIRNHSWSRPAPATPEGEVVSWADRIAYVCHDFEDAVTAGIVRADDLPDLVRDFCGTTRRMQLAGFIGAMIAATESTGRIAMTSDGAAALAAFRSFNYEKIYLRPASREQASRVIAVLQSLVEHLCADPTRLPPRLLVDDSDAGVRHAAVSWVAGMTDRYAITAAREWLDFDADSLPQGIHNPG